MFTGFILTSLWITLRCTRVHFVILNAVKRKRRRNKDTHCTRNGRNGAVILIANAGRMSAKSMAPVETVLHVRVVFVDVSSFISFVLDVSF